LRVIATNTADHSGHRFVFAGSATDLAELLMTVPLCVDTAAGQSQWELAIEWLRPYAAGQN